MSAEHVENERRSSDRVASRLLSPSRLVRIACFLALAGLAAMSWSVVDPRPIPVFVAMSVGQVIGTFSLLLFLFVLVLGATRKGAGGTIR